MIFISRWDLISGNVYVRAVVFPFRILCFNKYRFPLFQVNIHSILISIVKPISGWMSWWTLKVRIYLVWYNEASFNFLSSFSLIHAFFFFFLSFCFLYFSPQYGNVEPIDKVPPVALRSCYKRPTFYRISLTIRSQATYSSSWLAEWNLFVWIFSCSFSFATEKLQWTRYRH